MFHNFGDNRRYCTHKWRDETSMFDPKGVWCYGLECYMRTFKCRIPKRIENKPELITEFINRYYEHDGFWVDE